MLVWSFVEGDDRKGVAIAMDGSEAIANNNGCRIAKFRERCDR